MDHAAFHVIYADKRVHASLDGRYLQGSASRLQAKDDLPSQPHQDPTVMQEAPSEDVTVRDNVDRLLSNFNRVHFCTSRESCMATVSQLEPAGYEFQPLLVILEASMALEEGRDDGRTSPDISYDPLSRTPSLLGASTSPNKDRASVATSTSLLRIIASRATSTSTNQILPIALLHSQDFESPSRERQSTSRETTLLPPGMLRCLEDGATDVFPSALAAEHIRTIASQLYRLKTNWSRQRASFQEAKKSRKRSWVGIDDRKPYAYLREEIHLSVDSREDLTLASAFTSWKFSAHDFSEDQLAQSAFLMIQHTLGMDELERWRLPAAELKSFVSASRAAYNSFVHYHNFRHVVDVMQAIFYFLLRLGTIPPYSRHITPSPSRPAFKSPIASLLQPFDALTLLISALGHDAGHPGVNNAFLVALNAPLAQLYNDKSVLESFHCAAYSQILRRYWGVIFEDKAMRALMINSILATDMGLHFKYMADLGNLQEKVFHNNGTEGWSSQVLDEHRSLTCALLIKCADISNVARPFDIAAAWADILQLEFANQGAMEGDLGMTTTLFGGPPELGNIIKLANSQNGFMNIFACPLFEAVGDILPSMKFAVDEMKANQEIWRRKIEEQNSRGQKKKSFSSESFLSPRSGSPSRSSSQPELSHPEGLPASQTSSHILPSVSSSTNAESEAPRRTSTASISFRSTGVKEHLHAPDSQRSSSAAPLGRMSPSLDSNTYSRRSSGISFTGQGIPQTLAARRLSNTSPTQLQLNFGVDPRSSAFQPVPAAENIQPERRGSEGTLSQTNISAVTSDTGSRNVSITGGSGGVARKGSKSSERDQTFSQQRSLMNSAARHNPYATHERHSSGGHTSRSQSVPYSPTETQATSVTEDSDDRTYQLHERGGGITIKTGTPEVVDAEQLGSGHRATGASPSSSPKGVAVKTAIVNGGTGGHHSSTDRLITRKSSRFLNFWKKRGKTLETGP
ncbi:MAG: hypothetical protein Q9220_001422 [cf. Caloplaca sp. 1 TL-2023]